MKNDRTTEFYTELQIPAAPSSHFSAVLSPQLCPGWIQEYSASPTIQLGVSQGGSQCQELSCSPRSGAGGTEEPVLGMSPREGSVLSPRRDLGDLLGSSHAPPTCPSNESTFGAFPNPFPQSLELWGSSPPTSTARITQIYLFILKKPNGLFYSKQIQFILQPQLSPPTPNYSPH